MTFSGPQKTSHNPHKRQNRGMEERNVFFKLWRRPLGEEVTTAAMQTADTDTEMRLTLFTLKTAFLDHLIVSLLCCHPHLLAGIQGVCVLQADR